MSLACFLTGATNRESGKVGETTSRATRSAFTTSGFVYYIDITVAYSELPPPPTPLQRATRTTTTLSRPRQLPHSTSASLAAMPLGRSTGLLDLPAEIFKQILADAVKARGLKRALRLRLVNSM